MTIAALNRRWRPPVLLAIWAAAVILLWIDLEWLHRAAAATLGVFALLSVLDARREPRLVVALIAAPAGPGRAVEPVLAYTITNGAEITDSWGLFWR